MRNGVARLLGTPVGGRRWLRGLGPAVLAGSFALLAPPAPCRAGIEHFGTVTLTPDFELDGAGTNVDSIAFFEAPDPEDTLLFVTAKGNQRVEVWRFPFLGGEQPPLAHPSFGTGTQVNGVAVDAATDRLYVSVSSPESTVAVFSLPTLAFLGELIAGAVNLRSEPNVALLHRPDGASWLYVSADTIAHVRDAQSGAALGSFNPSAGLETMVADDRDQAIYIPDENGGTGVYAYQPLGAPHLRNGTNHFGAGVFDSDAEGIILYRCSENAETDDGTGFLVVADQRADHTEFEFFDRATWEHLGTLVLTGVANTDGVGSTQRTLPGWPRGVFAAIDDDSTTAVIGWHRILSATGLSCAFATPVPALAPGSRWLLALALAAVALVLRSPRVRERFL
jgi:phytase-like protein